LVTQEKIDTLFEQSLSGDYTENNKEIDQILESITKENEPEKYKKEVAILTLIKVRNILNEGNYTYAEQEAKNQITELIVQIEENGVDYVDPVYKNYLL
jgi:response regulator of citrate/malate metabolism